MLEEELLPENKIIGLAVEAVYRETGLKLRTYDEPFLEGRYFDATIEVEGYEHLRFTAEVKRWVQQANLGAVINQIEQLPGKGMLVADYINPKMADKLREVNVPFIDTMGNAYINEKPLFIYIKGNKKGEQATKLKTQRVGRAFQTTGLKVLFAFIRDPGLVNAPYRDIADITGVALGTVGWVINDLKQGEYLIEYGKKHRRLKNKKELINKWVDAYLQKLRPKLFLGTFTTENPNWWMDVDENVMEYGARWGGEVAAAKLTGHLKPEEITLYVPKEEIKHLLAENRLHKDPNGNVQIYKAFWKNKEELRQEYLEYITESEYLEIMEDDFCVNPLIAYADLLATNDPRNLETARMLYDERIVRLIERD